MLVLLVDVVPRRVLGLFDHLGSKYAAQLNGAGSGTFTVAIPQWRDLLTQSGMGVARTFLYLVEESTPSPSIEWWGMVWDADADVQARTVQLAASGIQTVLERRTLRRDLSFAQQDQTTIAAALIAEAQTGASRDLYIETAGLVATGIKRDRTYLGIERPRLGTLLQQLAAVIDGFDYAFDAVWPGGGTPPRHLMGMTYPAPRTTPVTTIVARGNTTLLQVTITGTNMTSDVDGFGNNDLRTTDSAPIPGYPAFDGAVNLSTVVQAATLTQAAQRLLAANGAPRVAAKVRVLVPAGQPMPVRPGQCVRLLEVDTGFDRIMIVSDLSVEQAGAGRQATVGLVEPASLARSDEATGP